MSLQDLVDVNKKLEVLKKLRAKVSEISGYVNFKRLLADYPDKFDDKKLLQFQDSAGAGKKGNNAETFLRSYVLGVMGSNKNNSQSFAFNDSISLVTLPGDSISSDNSKEVSQIQFSDSHSVVLHLKSKDEDVISNALNAPSVINVLAISTDEEVIEAVIRQVEKMDSQAMYRKVYFEDPTEKPDVSNSQFVTNLKYSVLVGKVYKPPVTILQKNINNSLPLLIQKMASPHCKVTLFSQKGLDIPQAHLTDNSNFNIQYLADEEAIGIFSGKLESQVVGHVNHFDLSEGEHSPAKQSSSASNYISTSTPITTDKSFFSPSQHTPKAKRRRMDKARKSNISSIFTTDDSPSLGDSGYSGNLK